jgi:hypothetical protein
MEFRLDPAFRRLYRVKAIGGLITAALLAWLGISTHFYLATVFAVAVALPALLAGIQWARPRMAVTRVDESGIETRVFRSRRVAWANVKEIRVIEFDRVGRVGVRGGFVGGSGQRNSGGGHKKTAYVKIVRYKGRPIELAAPLVTRDTADSDFDKKVRALRSAHAFAVKADVKTANPVVGSR